MNRTAHQHPYRMMVYNFNVLHSEPPGGLCLILGNYVKENGASHECFWKMKLYDINVLHSEQLRSLRLILGNDTISPSIMAMSMIICVSLNTLCEPRNWCSEMQGGKDSQNLERQTSFIRFETWIRTCFIYQTHTKTTLWKLHWWKICHFTPSYVLWKPLHWNVNLTFLNNMIFDIFHGTVA